MKIEEIQNLVRNGKTAIAKKQLSKFLKNNKLSSSQQITVSGIYKSIGQYSHAIKIIGGELSLEEMKIASPIELHRQIVLANTINSIGGKYVSQRIFNNLHEAAKNKGIEIQNIEPRYYNYLANYFVDHGDFVKAKEYCELALKNKNLSYYNTKIYQIVLSRIALNQDDFIAGIKILKNALVDIKADQKSLRWMLLNRLGLAYFQKNEHHVSNEILQESFKLMDKDFHGAEKSFLLRLIGANYFKMEDYKNSEKYLNLALKNENLNNAHPTFLISVYYWKSKLTKSSLTLGQKIALLIHPVMSNYSFMAGRYFNKEISKPLTDSFMENVNNFKKDCLVVSNGKATPAEYIQENVFKSNQDKYIIDLYSGVINNESGEIQNLTELQSKCLFSIIAAGSIGINKWALSDLIYQQNFYDATTGEQRLSKLVSELRKIGFEIKLNKNIFTFNIEKHSALFILPMLQSLQNKYMLLKSQGNSFVRADLENVFSIKTSTAKKWIKNWQEQDLIAVEGQGKNTLYKFSA